MEFSNEIIERFKNKIEKTATCWNWSGLVDKDGYGVMRIGGRKVGRTHRISWIINNGEIHNKLWVLHHCDNPCCVNPGHLYLGTAKDNAKDRTNRQRNNYQNGEDRYNVKLSDSAVLNIIKEYCPRIMTQKMLSKKYNVSQATISLVLNRNTWKHLKREKIMLSKKETSQKGNRIAKKINSVIADEIRTEYSYGNISQQQLGNKFGINQRMVSNIILNKNW